MDPLLPGEDAIPSRMPRVSGDGPDKLVNATPGTGAAPRERGWTAVAAKRGLEAALPKTPEARWTRYLSQR